ncbi:Protein phosphatase 2C 1 [Tritrichomonas foetus]|uniref:Protein phosphatase 2C 1 n=1 Tax=Tritrichomonas foetus TaxID=1144522 RepID=A0A1J4K7L2_9EUKA|nr:Protein phosphatase 2C 1 [Tritrichomonas foetus]|eukprot:OHT05700.1 Protein phosphatase 2C 1 [Tritrichomonas foetus]
MAFRPRAKPVVKNFFISGNQLYSGGHSEAKGKRTTMEDRCTIVGEFAGENTQFYGIFDGHGGGECSTYVANHLHPLIAKKISEGIEVFDAMQESIDEINKHAVEKWKNQGTTVAIAVIIKDKLYTANVGDSRLVLVNEDGSCQRLSYDHKATDRSEQERIRANCGLIQDGRVGGFLALSRAVGDGAFEGFISCEAYMTVTDFTHDQGLIIACDGVWDVLTDQEAADIYNQSADASTAAKNIKQAAIDNKTTDNVVVLCVDLMPKALKEEKQ